MANFQILLCTNRSPGSWVLRLIMWSRWSHSAVLDTEAAVVYDSTLFHGGVRKWAYEDFKKLYPTFEAKDCQVAPSIVLDARLWLESQIHKRYDWTALIGFLFRRNWQEPDAWFCSELSETFRTLFSIPKLRLGLWRVTPHHQDIVR